MRSQNCHEKAKVGENVTKKRAKENKETEVVSSLFSVTSCSLTLASNTRFL